MPRRDVTTPTTALLRDGIFYWPFQKIISLVFTYNNFELVYKKEFKSKITNEQKKIILAQIQLEIMITSVHCAEILASYLLAFEKQGKAIQRALFKYKVKDINEFYNSIKNKRNSFIMKIFSYPQLQKVKGKTLKRKIQKSTIKIKKELCEIAKYYSENLNMYNSYKHGLRVSAFIGQGKSPKKTYGIIGYMTPDTSYYPASVTLIRIDHKKAVKLTSIMTSLLLNSTQNYLNKNINDKNDSIILF